jgi:hypothetical protein
MTLKNLILIPLVIISLELIAQVNSDLIMIDVKKVGKNYSIDENSVQLLTNREGYDNQPSFINDKEMAFSSSDKNGNFDIIIYNFDTKRFTNLTKTEKTNEYSPRITDCGLYVSAVTVEENGNQRLWLYPINFGEPELLYDDIAPVGYYDWYNNKAAMFVLGNPNQMVYAYGKNDIYKISENIGRSVQKRPETSTISYVNKNIKVSNPFGEGHLIQGFDVEKREIVDLAETIPGSEDFIWMDKNTLLMGLHSDLYIYHIIKKEWTKLGSISLKNHSNISRLSYSSKLKKLVLVMDRNSGSN